MLAILGSFQEADLHKMGGINLNFLSYGANGSGRILATISPALDGKTTLNLSPGQPYNSNIQFTTCGTWTISVEQDTTANFKIWGAGGGAGCVHG